MKATMPDAPIAPTELSLRRGPDWTALGALAVLSFRQNIRGRRLLVLSLLFLLPSVLAVITRLAPYPPTPIEMEFAFIFILIPSALVTLTALLYGAGTIQDEVEEQTLTYLLLRPLPRWMLYLTKLLMTWLTTLLLSCVFMALTFIVIYWGTPELWSEAPMRMAKTAGLFALALAGYCSGFGALGLYTRRSLIVGLFYIVAFEWLLANIEFVGRRLTVMYYFRVLTLHWLESKWAKPWSIKLDEAPTVSECLYALLGITLVFALLGAIAMMRTEFRMKTPEGN
jgi:ABC-2 type transport system permease protein